MKRYLSLFLLMLMLLQCGCAAPGGADSSADSAAGSSQLSSTSSDGSQDRQIAAYLPDPALFLGEAQPDTAQYTDTQHGMAYYLKPEEEALAYQYLDVLLEGGYPLEVIARYDDESATARVCAAYLRYTGPGQVDEVAMDKHPCHLFLGIRRDDGDRTNLTLVWGEGFALADTGARADLSVLTPPVPDAPPESTPPVAPVTPSTPATPTVPTLDPNDPAVIPDFLDYDPTGAFRAGTSAYDHAVCFLAAGVDYYDTAEGYVRLLTDKGYRVTKTDEKIKRTYGRYQWNLYHDGLDLDTIEDDTYVRVKFLYRHNDGDPKTEISIGYSIGITYAGEEQYKGGGGSSVGGGGRDPYVPDHAKLPCLTCGGDGDCNACGGYGYVGFGDARAACGQCHRSGDCRTCGGSGTR